MSTVRLNFLYLTGELHPWSSKQDLNNNTEWHASVDEGTLTRSHSYAKSYRQLVTTKKGTISPPQGQAP